MSTTTSYYDVLGSSPFNYNDVSVSRVYLSGGFSATSDAYGNVVVRNKTTGEVKSNIASSLLSELQNPTSDFKAL